MLLVIHNLPSNSKYADIKSLIQAKCGLSEVILDNLVNEGQTKRVTVGLADDGDAAILNRKINGLYIGGQQLYVEDVRQKKESDQPYRSSKSLLEQSNSYDPFFPTSPTREPQQNQGIQDPTMAYQSQNPMNMLMNYNMAAIGGMYCMPTMPQPQTSYLGYGGQQMAPLMPQTSEILAQNDRPFGFNTERAEERQSYGDRRGLSPPRRGRKDDDRRSSRWDEPRPEARVSSRRRSRSPPREQWRSRELSDHRQNTSGDYMEDLMTRNIDQGYGRAQQESYPDYLSSNFSGSQSREMPSSNVFGNHVTQQSTSRWESNQNRSDAQPRGGRNTGGRGGSRPYESQNSNRSRGSAPAPSRQTDRRRDDSGVPPKRGNKWDSDEPAAKRFAPPKKLETGKNWREPGPQRPAPPKAGPKGPSNAPNSRDRKPEPGFANNSNDPPESLEKLLMKDDTWRGQAAASLAKDMMKTMKVRIPVGHKIFTHLKHSIRARINVMLGDQISIRTAQIIEMYQAKFPASENQKFFSSVVNNLKKQEIEAEKQALGEVSGPSKPAASAAKPAATKSVAKKPVSKKPVPKPAPQPDLGPDRLPKFPVGDKKTYKHMKAEDKKEWHVEDYNLPEDLKKALDDEIDVLSDIFMSECMNPDDEKEKVVCEQISDIVTDDFRKIVRIHVSRRLLDITKSLIVRVHATMRNAQKPIVEKFLKQHGCISLQKSVRHGQFLMAHVDTYENYDKLIAMGTAQVDDIILNFKPFQVCGPPPSARVVRQQHMERKNKFIKSMMDKSKENILKPGYVYKIKKDDDENTENNEQGAQPENQQAKDVASNENDEAPDENVDTQNEDDIQYNEENENLEEADDNPEDNVDEDDLEDY